METATAHVARRAAEEFDVTVVAATIDPGLRALVHWSRVPVPARPFALKFGMFWAVAGARLRMHRGDLVHTVGAIVPNHVDLASVHYLHAVVDDDTRGSAAETGRLRGFHHALVHRLALAAERWSYRPSRLRRFAAVSAGVGDDLAAAYPGIEVTITPNGVDTARYSPDPVDRARVRAEQAVADDELVAVFVGGDWVRKGLAAVIAALALAVRGGARVRLWVIGSGDADRYRALAADDDVADLVTFFGFRPDAEHLLRGADVFVLPSRYETFCLAAFEAAAVGLPLVVTPVPDVRALVRDGSGGVLVDPTGSTAAAIAEALRTYADDPARRAADGAAARARASAFTWDAATASVTDVYRELLESRP
ncbi:MAG: glycosyltransferase family 4 protein [Acidimicrobiia bacterium]